MDEDETAPAERPPAGKTGRRTRRVSPAAWGRERGGAEMDEQEAAPAEKPPDVSSHASVTALTPPTRGRPEIDIEHERLIQEYYNIHKCTSIPDGVYFNLRSEADAIVASRTSGKRRRTATRLHPGILPYVHL